MKHQIQDQADVRPERCPLHHHILLRKEIILNILVSLPFTRLITFAEHFVVYDEGSYFDSRSLPNLYRPHHF